MLSNNSPVPLRPLTILEARELREEFPDIGIDYILQTPTTVPNTRKFLKEFRDTCSAQYFLTIHNKTVGSLTPDYRDLGDKREETLQQFKSRIDILRRVRDRFTENFPLETPEDKVSLALEALVQEQCPHTFSIAVRENIRVLLANLELEVFDFSTKIEGLFFYDALHSKDFTPEVQFALEQFLNAELCDQKKVFKDAAKCLYESRSSGNYVFDSSEG